VVLALAHAHPGLRHHRCPAAAAIVAVVGSGTHSADTTDY
jgi:hypothetical protein